MSEPSREDLRATYALLSDRLHALQSATWSIITMTLAAEAALWVGLLTVEVDSLPTLLFASAFLVLGTTAPLAIRFVELSSMLDRQLLDEFEENMGLPDHLRLDHGRRLEERFVHVLPRLPEEAQARARKRRISKHPDDALIWMKVDALLTQAGQPTIVWTVVIALAGTTGMGTAVGLAFENGSVVLAVVIVMLALVIGPYALATERGPLARWRDSMRGR